MSGSLNCRGPVLVLMLLLLSISGCSGADKAAPIILKPFDHSYAQYNRLLAAFTSDGWVDYSNLNAHRAILDSIVVSIESADLTQATSEQKLAFYINAYNALTLRAIVDHYPVKSIKDISGVWDKIKFAVAGEQRTLGQIEHEILRKQFDEPRIHCSIVCASISCPPLQPWAFVSDSLNSQLDIAASAFALSTERNRLDPTASTAELSAIFNWFGGDFVAKYYSAESFKSLSKEKNAALNFLINYFPEASRAELRRTKFDVEYAKYDWSLNERK